VIERVIKLAHGQRCAAFLLGTLGIFGAPTLMAQGGAPAQGAPASATAPASAPANPAPPLPRNPVPPMQGSPAPGLPTNPTPGMNANPAGAAPAVAAPGVPVRPAFGAVSAGQPYILSGSPRNPPWLQENFARCDSNHDGRLSALEYAHCSP